MKRPIKDHSKKDTLFKNSKYKIPAFVMICTAEGPIQEVNSL